MLSSIHPLGERARNNRWGLTAGAFVVGATAGGVTLGVLSGTAGLAVHSLVGWSEQAALISALVAVAFSIVGDTFGWAGVLPWPRRQVNEDWLATYRGWVYGAGFGFQLGAGLFTYVATLGVYTTIIIAALAASVAQGAFIGAAFGLFRGLPMLTTARIHDPDALRSYHVKMARWTKPARSVTIAAQVIVLGGVFALVVVP